MLALSTKGNWFLQEISDPILNIHSNLDSLRCGNTLILKKRAIMDREETWKSFFPKFSFDLLELSGLSLWMGRRSVGVTYELPCVYST